LVSFTHIVQQQTFKIPLRVENTDDTLEFEYLAINHLPNQSLATDTILGYLG